ncbi:carbohydrate porin [Bradyrhizobium japonicum]|uniref:carbohydrate porin n=1 Tax=Bradyrhizobium japonicum TaxID=375 RepID=UPI00209F65E4|nr:carbohydrate porin [Bradyrhizobium japonicum]MCP1765483.1 carbohydrate-selective porin OprB [Bradyrhizobium japonicum]MCP1818430.1 carbohydrate-selective porin OprB [Bradyrhizobium japonicum]MCP1870060.1 carbohydrate-selective porin OprB [Bradyrhizobium japonicum]MCP1938037.1 carbohydrate-selective porin OprB [Bradyrhizobium japonicum]MCP1951233.1 carbohydrate-selective porin OprB [Bradyrhizobium japonicum]
MFSDQRFDWPERHRLLRGHGLEFVGLSDGRPKDKFGLAMAYAHVSPRARALDFDFRRLLTPDWPPRSFEGLVTAVYQYELRAGWTLQPNFQFIVRPGAARRARSPLFPARLLKTRKSSVFEPCLSSDASVSGASVARH